MSYCDDDLVMIDEEGTEDSSTSSVRQLSSSTADGGHSGGPAITARLHIVPNIATEASDAESIVDNDDPRILRHRMEAQNPPGGHIGSPIGQFGHTQQQQRSVNNFIPDMDDDDLNNLDIGGPHKLILTEQNKYLIPDLSDTDEPLKPVKDRDDKNKDDVRDAAANMRAPIVRTAGPNVAGRSYIPPAPPMSRSESVSSLNSEASLPPLGDISTSSRRSSTRKRRTSASRKRRPNVKPRLKTKFGDATLQYIRDRICGRIFSGWVEDRRRLETVARCGGGVEEAWRDVVEVDSCEVEMSRQLEAVMASVPGAREGDKWINVTAPTMSRGHMMWTLLDGPRPPDHYWLRVTAVTPHPTQGLTLHLHALRKFGERDAESATARSRRLAIASAAAAGNVPLSLSLAWRGFFASVKASCTGDAVNTYAAAALSPASIAYGIKVTVLALVSVILAIGHGGRELARLLLRLVSETGTLIDRATPLLQTVMHFFEKIVGGIFLLIAMVYKDIRRPSGGNPSSGGGLSPPPGIPTASIMASDQQYQQYTVRSTNISGRTGPISPGPRRYVAPDDWVQ